MARSSAARMDPREVLPGVRSVVVGAVRYAPSPPPRLRALDGRVSCYAWGDDYHDVVGRMAAGLAGFLRERYGAVAREYVDTGPVLERLWGAHAGVGWIGKNAMVLNKDYGSFFFLAVILTDALIGRDEPAADQCGACTLCVDACPTGAIVEPRVVDSRRCLSYHTIELRGPVPGEFRADFGRRAFGCDDCQTVCPWNAGDHDPPAPFRPRNDNGNPDLPELLSMELADYTRRFRGSAMKRSTYQGLRRNAAIALGNLLSPDGGAADIQEEAPPEIKDEDRRRALEALTTASTDADRTVAEASRWALEQARTPPDS